MSIHGTARFQVRPDVLEACSIAIAEFVTYVREHEPDTQLYVSLQDRDDPTQFLHYFIFVDQAAQERHASSDAVNRFTAVLYPHLVEPVHFAMYEVFATTESKKDEP